MAPLLVWVGHEAGLLAGIQFVNGMERMGTMTTLPAAFQKGKLPE
jgi:hypothetical protein